MFEKEEMETPIVPFMGGERIPSNATPEQLADWIHPEDRVPLLLAFSLYHEPRMELDWFFMIPGSYMIRSAAWFDTTTGECIIAFRGTQGGAVFGAKDLADDTVIAGFGSNYCDLTLVQEGQKLYDQIKDKATKVTFVGHSLGGTAALCMASRNSGTYSISYNGGAVATNPVLNGPGPEFARFYHVVGDIISTHIGREAADVIRVYLPSVSQFGNFENHRSHMTLKGEEWRYMTADEEDAMFLQFASAGVSTKTAVVGTVLSPLLAFAAFMVWLKVNRIGLTSPIPGSQRYAERKAMPYDFQLGGG